MLLSGTLLSSSGGALCTFRATLRAAEGVCGAIVVRRRRSEGAGARVFIKGAPDRALPPISSQLKKKLSSASG